MVPVTTLLTTANYYISTTSSVAKSTADNNTRELINKYINSTNFADEIKINKLIENNISKIEDFGFEQLELWTNIVNDLRYQKYLLQDQPGIKLQKTTTILDVIKKNLKIKFTQAIAETNPDNVDFSKFDYFTKEIHEIEKTNKNPEVKENLVKEKLNELSLTLYWKGGFPKDLNYTNWLGYKKAIVFLSQNHNFDKEKNILTSLYKTYLFLFIDKEKRNQSNTNQLIQTFFAKNIDCDEATSFTYFTLLANGAEEKQLHLLHINTGEEYAHAVLCLKINGEYYIIDDATIHNGNSCHALLKKLFARDISKAQINILNPDIYIDFFHNRNYFIKKDIKLNELETVLIKLEQ